VFVLSANIALVAFYGLLEKGKEVILELDYQICFIVIPFTGLIICIAWFSLLVFFRNLNQAKFIIIQELEKDFCFRFLIGLNPLPYS